MNLHIKKVQKVYAEACMFRVSSWFKLNKCVSNVYPYRIYSC